MIGGKDKLQLSEGTWTFLPLPQMIFILQQQTVHSQPCSPRNGNFQQLADLLLFVLEYVCLCTCIHIDV